MNDPITQVNDNLHQVLLALQEEVIALRKKAVSDQKDLLKHRAFGAMSNTHRMKDLKEMLEIERADKELYCKQRDSKQRDITVFQGYVKERDAKIAELNQNLAQALQELKNCKRNLDKVKKEKDSLAKIYQIVEAWNRRSPIKRAFSRLKLPRKQH